MTTDIAQRRYVGYFFLLLLVLILTAGQVAYLSFDWPDFLRTTPAEILETFHAASPLSLYGSYYLWVLTWLAFCTIPVLLVVCAARTNSLMAIAAVPLGCLAGLCHAIGPARWVFVVPVLAAEYSAIDTAPATQAAVLASFQAVHQFGGVMIGEHLGNLLKGAWTILFCLSLADGIPKWLQRFGLFAGLCSILASFEQLGGLFAELIEAMSVLQFVWFLWGAVFAVMLIRRPVASTHA